MTDYTKPPTYSKTGVPFDPQLPINADYVAAVRYSGNLAKRLNTALRTGKGLTPELLAWHKRLHDMMSQAAWHPEGVQVARALVLPKTGVDRLLKAFSKSYGKSITLPGYQSTSRGEEPKFLYDDESPHIQLNILAHHGLNLSRASLHQGEDEILLPHNSKYKVLGYGYPKSATHRPEVTLEQQPPG